MRNFPYDKLISVRQYDSVLSREAEMYPGRARSRVRDAIVAKFADMLAERITLSPTMWGHEVIIYQTDLVVMTPVELVQLVNTEALAMAERMDRMDRMDQGLLTTMPNPVPRSWYNISADLPEAGSEEGC
jgi:hypothetical protein